MAGSVTANRRKRTRELQQLQQQNTNVVTGNQRQKSERQKNRHGTSVNSIKKEEEKQLAKKLSSACDVDKVIVTSHKDKSNNVDLTGGLVLLQYFESLLSNTIGATYTYSDTGNTANNQKTGTNCENTGTAIDKLPIVGGEDIELSFTDNRDNNLSLKLKVNGVTPFDDKTTKSAAQLQLVSEELYNNQEEPKRVELCYEGKISEHIKKIAEENLKTTKTLDIETTGGKNLNFVGHKRKPFYCINLLSTKAVPQGEGKEGNSAGFIFWETSDGYHFKSLDTLLGQEQKKSVIYNESPSDDDSPGAPGYDLKALDYSRNSAINVEHKMMMGAYSTKLMSFNIYDAKFDETLMSSAKAFEGGGSQDFLSMSGEELPDLGLYSQTPTKTSYLVLDQGVQPGGTTDEQLDKSKEENFDTKGIYNQSVMRYNQLFASTITLTIAGDFSLHAGDALFVDIATLKADTKGDDINEKDGGVYIISDLTHYISKKETYTKMNLVRDSTGRKGKHTFRKGTNAHTVMQDNFLPNIK